jgi:hypothetical protein
MTDAFKPADTFEGLKSQVGAMHRELEAYRTEELERQSAEGRREAAEERREQRQRQRQDRARAALDRARADAIRAIARLLPQAVKQAKAGKPALLRMILRATR